MISRSEFKVFVEGKAIPQGSKKAFKRGNQIVLVEANPALREWRGVVSFAAQKELARLQLVEPFTGPVGVELRFGMPKPKTVTRELPSVPPDLDKLVRAIFDALTDARVWSDDSLVCELKCSKVYESFIPGVSIRVYDLQNT